MVLYPATANTLNRLAAGLADDLIGALFLARAPDIPYFIAPAMNHQMWAHPATQKSVGILRDWGCRLLNPGEGLLACGEEGEGRLMEPEEVLKALEITAAPKTRGKILITSGGTREPIDGVRYIGNSSSGRTGARLAEAFVKAGFEVTYLAAESAVLPQIVSPALKNIPFRSFADLNSSLKNLLANDTYAAVVHAAAVSDYSLSAVEGAEGEISTEGKLDSRQDLTLRLKRNFKILSRIKSYSRNPQMKLIGFKLTVEEPEASTKAKIHKMFEESEADFVVHNELAAVGVDRHEGRVHFRNGNFADFKDKAGMAEILLRRLSSSVPEPLSKTDLPEVIL
jgi:phosphopantothenoylcysteine decarboxylase/phosphopantothenate--cysteine ligase